MLYPALLPLMRTSRLPVVDGTDVPADLNGLVRFAERRNMVSARVPSHFKRSLLYYAEFSGQCSRKANVGVVGRSDKMRRAPDSSARIRTCKITHRITSVGSKAK
jgi:hypothetical protein